MHIVGIIGELEMYKVNIWEDACSSCDLKKINVEGEVFVWILMVRESF